MMLDHDQISRRIPHSGSMCLLNEIVNWDAQQIHARANSHRQLDNPLRNSEGLGIAAGIEYAGQTMAVHGSLSSDGQPRAGRLASTRGVQCHVRWLDQIEGDLDIVARKISGDDAGMVYDFEISAGSQLLISGRASVALNPVTAPH
jgi:predicted hotdog family 3-hydroxylacyl-ACP dehydratase